MAQSERISIGVVGGVAFAKLTGGGFGSDESKRFTVGPVVQFHLNEHVSLEASFLYTRTGGQYLFGGRPDPGQLSGLQLLSTAGQIRSNNWAMPVLGKYTF